MCFYAQDHSKEIWESTQPEQLFLHNQEVHHCFQSHILFPFFYFKEGIIIVNSLVVKLVSLCLPVVQSFTLCPLEICSVKDPLPTSPFAVKQTHFQTKTNIKQIKKLRFPIFTKKRYEHHQCFVFFTTGNGLI